MTRHLLLTGAVVTAFAAAGGSAHAADADWHVTASGTITAAQAGVPPGTSAPRLARAAIERSAAQLRIGRHGGLRLVADRKAPTAERATAPCASCASSRRSAACACSGPT